MGIRLNVKLIRLPADISTMETLVSIANRYRRADRMDIEHEIMLIWTVFLPLILNPIVYFSFLGDHRRALMGVCKPAKEQHYLEAKEDEQNEEAHRQQERGSKTQVTDIL